MSTHRKKKDVRTKAKGRNAVWFIIHDVQRQYWTYYTRYYKTVTE